MPRLYISTHRHKYFYKLVHTKAYLIEKLTYKLYLNSPYMKH